MPTSVPFPAFGPRGFIAPAESDVLAGVSADINTAFGGNLNMAPETPQGQLAVSQAAIIGHANDLFLAFVNQIDPAYSDGRMQDALARIYFLERHAAQPTVVQATCTGLVGTIIPAGALAKAVDGNLYVCDQAGTIDGSGSIVLQFECSLSGPVQCAPGALNIVYRAIPGWDSITNGQPGVAGRDVEDRAAFEARRAASVALNSVGSLDAVRAAVLNVPGVIDVYATENATSAAVTTGGVTLAKNSLFLAVAGGAPDAVVRAIWSKKMPGCGYTGTTTVNVVASEGYAQPYPTYPVSFTIAAGTPVKFNVQLANNPGVPSDVVQRVRIAIQAAFTGSDGGQAARIGSAIYASRFYAAVAKLGDWVQIVSITLGPTFAQVAKVTMQIDQAPVVAASDILVTLT